VEAGLFDRDRVYRTASALLLLTLFAWSVRAGVVYRYRPNFEVPDEFWSMHEFHPVEYLENYKVSDSRAKLTPKTRDNLRVLFLAAYKSVEKKYKQDYVIRVNCPIVLLLCSNYSEVEALAKKSRGTLFLGTIARALSKAPSPSPLPKTSS
jgi:hypothetical protein